jgi:hypothetical protein
MSYGVIPQLTASRENGTCPSSYALSRFEIEFSKNKKWNRQKVAGSLVAHYFKRMKTTATKKTRRRARRKRNPLACNGWCEFIMRSVRADQAAQAAARARITVTGETLH